LARQMADVLSGNMPVGIQAPMPRRRKGVNPPAKDASQLRACRAGSKQAILIDHLDKGAALAELVAALKPWSESSVKSALYWALTIEISSGWAVVALIARRG
jgi:hypothetical protein